MVFARCLILSLLVCGPLLKGQVVSEEEEYHHCMMEENSISFGLGAPYSLQHQFLGVNSRLYYNLGEALCFGPEFSYFQNGAEEFWDVDLVVHYIFETPWAGLYPIVGMNYTSETRPHREQEFGVLWGVGAHRNIKSFTLFAEYSRVETGLFDQFITAGIMYRFKLGTHGDS